MTKTVDGNSEKKPDDIVLYHGSREGILGDIQPLSRMGTDFGTGFYARDKAEQALAIIRDNGSKKLFYTLYVDIANNTNGKGENLSIFQFSDSDIEQWALFIAYCRDKIADKASYKKLKKMADDINRNDIITGKIADDKMFVAFNEFFDSNMSIEGLGHCLKSADLGQQYVFKTAKACSIIRTGNIRKYNKATDDILTDSLRQEMKAAKATVIDDAKKKYRSGKYIEDILEEYK